MHLYSTLLCIVVHPKHFTIMCVCVCVGGLSSATTSVLHPLVWCDGCHRTTAPVRSPHTSYRWRGEREIEPIKCVRSPHTSYRWRGEREIEPIKCVRSPHTSYRWRGERVIEPIKCVRSPHTSYRWRGERVLEPIKWIFLFLVVTLLWVTYVVMTGLWSVSRHALGMALELVMLLRMRDLTI